MTTGFSRSWQPAFGPYPLDPAEGNAFGCRGGEAAVWPAAERRSLCLPAAPPVHSGQTGPGFPIDLRGLPRASVVDSFGLPLPTYPADMANPSQ